MTPATISTLAAMVLQISLGLAVFQANRHRLANQCFLLLSLTIDAWLGSLFLAFIAKSPEAAEFAIRQASAAAAGYLAVLNLLRLSVRQRQLGWKGLLAHSKTWLLSTLGIIALCQTHAFLKGAILSKQLHTPPTPDYGPAIYVFAIYIVVAFGALIVSYSRDIRNTKGGEHAELSFIFMGAIAAVAFFVLLSFVLDFFLGSGRSLWFAPFRFIILSLVIAYGIATRKILEVGFFMRRVISYGVLAVYLIGLYALIWWLSYSVFVPMMGPDGRSVAHLLAALVVAFAMAPARGVSQSLADRLFVGTRRLDFQATMNQAAAILRSVTTLADLLERFGLTIGQAVDTERVFLLLPEQEFYAQRFPTVQSGSRTTRMELHRDQAIIAHLERTQEPIILDELHRIRSTPELERVRRQMKSLHIGVAMGIFSREQLAGVMLLGPRRSGSIYGTVEQSALQVLCGQLAVAIENAQLFTEVQNAKIYN
ncbi:MAG TPA: GAF domain-containing protein, partial [Chthoniobacterales bacterium]